MPQRSTNCLHVSWDILYSTFSWHVGLTSGYRIDFIDVWPTGPVSGLFWASSFFNPFFIIFIKNSNEKYSILLMFIDNEMPCHLDFIISKADVLRCSYRFCTVLHTCWQNSTIESEIKKYHNVIIIIILLWAIGPASVRMDDVTLPKYRDIHLRVISMEITL